MKLLNYTTLHQAGVLLLLISLWALIFYIELLDEIYDSMDDGLENQKLLVIDKAQEDPDVLRQSSFEDGYYVVHPISESRALQLKENYRDTLMYRQNEQDYEPVRLLESTFKKGNKHYRIKVITSMVEEDDLVKELLFSIFWLYLGLILTILLLNSLMHKKAWRPFYTLITNLSRFRIDKDRNINFEETDIEEFKLLNSKVKQLLDKSALTYDNQKEFIENASHELQTPLAIIRNKLELLLEKNRFTKDQLEEFSSILNQLERLTQFNKSLLLLSKIENKQFRDEEDLNINHLLVQLLKDFEDIADHRGIRLELNQESDLRWSLNPYLGSILFSNLIKNALIHGRRGTKIGVWIRPSGVEIKNASTAPELDEKKIFSRFRRSGDQPGSTGLGLAISRAIAQRYHLSLSYKYDGQHSFSVRDNT